jgi:hypothetical protein
MPQNMIIGSPSSGMALWYMLFFFCFYSFRGGNHISYILKIYNLTAFTNTEYTWITFQFLKVAKYYPKCQHPYQPAALQNEVQIWVHL